MSKWMKRLLQMDGAINPEYNAFSKENIIQSPSPSLNWIFGKHAGIPRGSSILFYGPQKAGKSLGTYLIAGHIHQTDPEAIVIRFDTEMRAMFQGKGPWNIDYDRFIAYDTNKPEEVFDKITGELTNMVNEGMPLRAIIIDSMTALQGLRDSGADSVADNQMGDRAAVVTKGLKRILPFLRRNKILLMGTSHLRANFDAGLYGPKEKAALVWSERHFFEVFVEVKRDGSSDGKKDLLGNSLENEGVKDFRGNKEITGHKIYVKNTESSFGGAGRSGEFTIDYDKGLINTHEEVFLLAKNTHVVEMPNNRTYIFDNQKYNSKQEFLEALKENQDLRDNILKNIYNK